MRFPLALAVISVALSYADDSAALRHARRSYELSQAGQLDQAAVEMKLAIDAAPQNPLFHSALGGILSRQSKLAESKLCFSKAVELDGANPAFRSQLALKQWETGELEASRDNLLLLIDGKKASAETLQMLEAVSLDWGAVLARQARWRAGLRVARDTAARFPISTPVWQMVGLFEARNQENVAAIASYRRALELNQECVDCAIGLGMAQAAAGLADQATGTFKHAVARWPQHAVLRQTYGVHLLRVSDVEQGAREHALAQLRKALELDVNLVEARYLLGNEALENGNIADALAHLQTAAASSQQVSAKVYYALSRAWRRSGQEDKAADALRRFQELKAKEQP